MLPQDLVDLSTLIPTVAELDLQGFREDSLRLLAIKSNSPHGILFPRLTRLVIRNPCASELALSDMFYSRLHLASNVSIIENVALLQHAELHLPSAGRSSEPTYFGELYQDRPELHAFISQLRYVYSETVGLGKEVSGQAAEVIHRINRYGFPKPELGYCKETSTKQAYSPRNIPLLPLPQQSFFQKLDVAFTALERYRMTYADILINGAVSLMRGFSCVPETSFLHHPTYKFICERPGCWSGGRQCLMSIKLRASGFASATPRCLCSNWFIIELRMRNPSAH
ncbi:hypothetical protein BD779DRAFT_249795 [Infundibulicybe gibba]|nr:hypothetical protein BD779DRAFT_249795 [Infundibulicybe gibba]